MDCDGHGSDGGGVVTQYIDIDQRAMTINGQPVTEEQMAAKCQEIKAHPERYLCLFDNSYKGKYRYADTEQGQCAE